MMLKHVQKLGFPFNRSPLATTSAIATVLLCISGNELMARKWHDLLKSRRDSRRLIARRPSTL